MNTDVHGESSLRPVSPPLPMIFCTLQHSTTRLKGTNPHIAHRLAFHPHHRMPALSTTTSNHTASTVFAIAAAASSTPNAIIAEATRRIDFNHRGRCDHSHYVLPAPQLSRRDV